MLAEAQKSTKPDRAAIADHPMDGLPGTSQSCKNTMSKSNAVYGFDKTGAADDVISLRSMESFVCRICHNNENAESLISPCLCKGSLTYVHSYCLERWIGLSRCTICELCHFQYNTQQTLRYNFCQSLRIWYSRPITRRALQEDCQMFLLLTLIAFGIGGTLLVAVQFYILQGHIIGLGRTWTRCWLIFFLITTLIVYIINAYLVIKAQLQPWYRWWQTARDIRLIVENHNPPYAALKEIKSDKNAKLLVEAADGTACQTAGSDCPQQRDESQQQSKRADGQDGAPCRNVLQKSEIFSQHNNRETDWHFMNEIFRSKLRLYLLFENNGTTKIEPRMATDRRSERLVTTV